MFPVPAQDTMPGVARPARLSHQLGQAGMPWVLGHDACPLPRCLSRPTAMREAWQLYCVGENILVAWHNGHFSFLPAGRGALCSHQGENTLADLLA